MNCSLLTIVNGTKKPCKIFYASYSPTEPKDNTNCERKISIILRFVDGILRVKLKDGNEILNVFVDSWFIFPLKVILYIDTLIS